METERTCTECTNGIDISEALTLSDGTVLPERRSKCTVCLGAGVLPVPLFDNIFEACTTTKGAKAGTRRFRKSPPEAWKKSTTGIENRRAYYVWRMTRFHGGADVTMPMMADLFCGRDAWRAELNAYAEALAIKVFGTDMAAAYRWASVMRGTPVPAGLPDTAYPSGPVHDGNKPGFEKPELN